MPMRRLFLSIALLLLALTGVCRAAITPYYITIVKGTNTYYASDLNLDTNCVSGLTISNGSLGHITAYIRFQTLSNSDTVVWTQIAPGVYQATASGSSAAVTNGLATAIGLNGTNPALRVGVLAVPNGLD